VTCETPFVPTQGYWGFFLKFLCWRGSNH